MRQSLTPKVIDELAELGATAAYFYALAVYNTGNYSKWRQNHNMDASIDEITRMLTLAVKKTRNLELTVRANFIMADTNERRGVYRYSYYWDTKPTNHEHPEIFMPYYNALSALQNTKFGDEIYFNCPAAAVFIK